MEGLSELNNLSYFDGLMITIWLGLVYYGKCWIDNRFNNKE